MNRYEPLQEWPGRIGVTHNGDGSVVRIILTTIVVVMTFLSANAYKYTYSFDNMPVSEAMIRISKDNPDVRLFFIYKELENYKTSAVIHTDDIYDALSLIIGLNPIILKHKNDEFYVEACQNGIYNIRGIVTASDGEPIAACIIYVLNDTGAPITYGITDANGCFVIPCDLPETKIQISCLGCKDFEASTPVDGDFKHIILEESPIMLNSVVVTAKQPRTVIKGNAMVVSVQNTVLAKLDNAYDVLSHIPMVTGINGELNVFGRGTPVVYINGREVRNQADLQQLKSDEIQSVELISNPGAAYASDIAAVIKIKTIPPIGDGFGFDLTDILGFWSYARNNADVSATDTTDLKCSATLIYMKVDVR